MLLIIGVICLGVVLCRTTLVCIHYSTGSTPDGGYIPGPDRHGCPDMVTPNTVRPLNCRQVMRPLRWKSRYLTGISETDVRISALVGMLNETAGEAKRVEHCRDLNDFFEQFTRLTEDMLIYLSVTTGKGFDSSCSILVFS